MSDQIRPLSEVLRDAAPSNTPIGRWLRQIYDEQQRRNRARRDRVLRHPEIASELTRPPLRFRSPSEWNGYIPPEHDAPEDGEIVHNRGQTNREFKRAKQSGANDSAARAVLVALCAAADEAERDAGRPVEPEQDIIAMFPFPFPGLKAGERYEPPAQPTLSAPHVEYESDRQHSPMRGPGRQ